MRKIVASIVVACVAALGIGASVMAAPKSETIQAILNNKLTFQVNGDSWTPPAAPISYNSTTYLPVRAVSNALGLDIKYDAASSSIIILTGTTGSGAVNGGASTSPAAVESKSITALLNYSLSFQINGESWTPSAPPISYNNTTYLPVRAISNALGIDIKYNATSSSITIVNESAGSGGSGSGGAVTPGMTGTLPFFESKFEAGGYELHTGQSDKLAYSGKTFKKVLYSDSSYQNFYIYPQGKYSTILLQMASSEATIVKFTDRDGKLLKSVEIPKGVIAPVPLDVKGITGDQYVTVHAEPAYNNLDGNIYVFDTSLYTNTPASELALLPAIPAKLPIFESQYEIGGYTVHSGESDKLTYNGKTYKNIFYSESSYQNFYVYPKGKFSTLILEMASTEETLIEFRSDKDELLKIVTIPKGVVTSVELDVSKVKDEHYIRVYTKPGIDDFEGEIYILETSYYKK